MKRGWRAISPSGRPPAGLRGGVGGGGISTSDSTPAGEHRERRLRDEGRGEQIRRPQILGDDHELRTDDAGHHAARQHPGDRLRPEGVARGVGGGEAIGLMRGRIEAAAERADAETARTSPAARRTQRDQAGEHAEHRADLQREAAAVVPRQPARSAACRATCRSPSIDDRQGREALSGASIGADDAAGRDDHGVVAAGQRLRDRQHQRVALGEAVVDCIVRGVSAIADIMADSRQALVLAGRRLAARPAAAAADQG